MKIAELPEMEELRLTDLSIYGLLDTAPEIEFDELRELAAQICDCPVSMITLIDKERQWFKSQQNVAVKETPRDFAFCAHTILNDHVMIVENAANDSRFFDNPLVTGSMNIRFYAGAPIVSPSGHNLGTICVIDQQPKTLTKSQERALTLLSNQVTKLLELRLKTNLIAQRAKELISINELSASAFIRQKDAESLSIAKELHENIAQDLAMVGLYLSTLRNDNRHSEFAETAQNAINKAVLTLKDLSYRFSPSTLESSSLKQLLDDAIEKNKMANVSIRLHVNSPTSAISFEQAVGCTRIIETWLQVLHRQKGLSFIQIEVQIENNILLTITDDAVTRSFEENEKELFFYSLYYRIIAMNGRVRFAEPSAAQNEMQVTLPIL